MLDPVNRPTDVCIGPNSSILVEPNSIFVKSVKVVVWLHFFVFLHVFVLIYILRHVFFLFMLGGKVGWF